MSNLPDDIEKLVNQPIVDMVQKHALSKGPAKDYTRLKEVLQFVQTEFDRLKSERLQKQQGTAQNPPQPATRRKRLVWPQKKS
ncbi:hypothetical protein [Alicyclobacillus ferrooxydans]|uniref:Uncharacterized protein n=1 Tax=Alicyclobacillus ferrooxydans TaxID=471514 RepID=A0A0P9CA68_9BACL|nr:hypothetical protein [Alicyclobacillus ferrooxydans]KPV42292.1 hypothetical protein AN477_18490 [Alicyclobacillus ferrooxydans]